MSNCNCDACRAIDKVHVPDQRDDLMDADDHNEARAHLDRAREEIARALELFDGITHPVVCVAEGGILSAARALESAVDLLEMGA